MLTCVIEIASPVVEFRIYIPTVTDYVNKDTCPNSVLPLQQNFHKLSYGLQSFLLPGQQLQSELVILHRVQSQPGLQSAGQGGYWEGPFLSEQLHVLADLQKNSIPVQ